MTPARLIKILASICGVLVLLWLVYLYTQVPHQKTPYTKAIKQADRIMLQRGSSIVQLHRTSITSSWMVSGIGGSDFATDDDHIKMLIAGLTDLQLEDAISDRADHASDFDVTPASGTRITLSASSKVLADGMVGKQSSDYSHIYFRFIDSPVVYLAGGLLRGELGDIAVSDWRRKELISLPDTQIQRIQIQSADGPEDFQRSSDTWTLDGKKIDPAPVYGLVGALSHLKAEDFVSPISSTWTVEGLSWASITVTTSSQTVVLRIGNEDTVAKRFPVVVSAPSFAWLSENKVQSLLPKRSSFRTH